MPAASRAKPPPNGRFLLVHFFSLYLPFWIWFVIFPFQPNQSTGWEIVKPTVAGVVRAPKAEARPRVPRLFRPILKPLAALRRGWPKVPHERKSARPACLRL